MKRLHDLLMRLSRLVDLDPSIDGQSPPDMAHRFGLAKSMLVVGLDVAAGLMILGALTTTAATILFQTITRMRSAVRLLLGISIAVLVTLVLHDVDVVWTFLYPPVAFYLLGGKKGFAAALGIVAVVGIILLFPWPGVVQRVNPTNLKLRYATCLLGSVAAAHIFERTRRVTRNQLISKALEGVYEQETPGPLPIGDALPRKQL